MNKNGDTVILIACAMAIGGSTGFLVTTWLTRPYLRPDPIPEIVIPAPATGDAPSGQPNDWVLTK